MPAHPAPAPALSLGPATLHLGDSRAILATLDADSLDACVTDPPYELGFMGKAWDRSGIAFDPAVVGYFELLLA